LIIANVAILMTYYKKNGKKLVGLFGFMKIQPVLVPPFVFPSVLYALHDAPPVAIDLLTLQ
jgi:hypothetical protein